VFYLCFTPILPLLVPLFEVSGDDVSSESVIAFAVEGEAGFGILLAVGLELLGVEVPEVGGRVGEGDSGPHFVGREWRVPSSFRGLAPLERSSGQMMLKSII